MRASDDDAARKRLGRLLTQARVEMDPKYKNRALFARERGISYRLAQDAENATYEVGGDLATRMAVSVAYGWTPDSFDRVLAGGDPVKAESSPRRQAAGHDGTRGAPRYADPTLQAIADLPGPEDNGLTDEEKEAFIALARSLRAARERGEQSA
jgi:hypothetical protein